MSLQLSKSIFVVGPMGAGKSSVARELSRQSGIACLDLDDFIVSGEGCSIPVIFEQGESHFRDVETRYLKLALPRKCIIAGGGGVVMREENRRLIRENSCCVYLYTDPETSYRRVHGDRNRPMLQSADQRKRLQYLLSVRDRLYRETAHIVIDSAAHNVRQCALLILTEYEKNYADCPY